MMTENIPRIVENYISEDGTDFFHEWMDDIADFRAQILIDKTIAKVRIGNLGKHKSVGNGVQEIKLDYGPGYRIYFGERGEKIILLYGSSKKRQQNAINKATIYWHDWKSRENKNETKR